MLRFFRTLRRKLIEEDNMRKYVWYAVGEVLLVMIGILLALQVNNWNQDRLDNQKATAFHNRLLEDMIVEEAILNNLITYLTTVEDHALSAMRVFEAAGLPEGTSEDEFLIDLYQGSQVYDPNQVSATYQELISSGQIGLIKDDELRFMIIIYYDIDWSIADVFANESPYRENVRKLIPSSIQEEIRTQCGDKYVKVMSSLEVELSDNCVLAFDPELSKSSVQNILNSESLKEDLRFHLSNQYSKVRLTRAYKEELGTIIERLKKEL